MILLTFGRAQSLRRRNERPLVVETFLNAFRKRRRYTDGTKKVVYELKQICHAHRDVRYAIEKKITTKRQSLV